MIRIRISALIVALVATLGVTAPSFAETAVFVNVNVVPMTDEFVIGDQTVVVTNGKIVAIGGVDTVPVPEGAVVIDGTDRFLMPGLAEMHAHVTSDDGFDRLATLFVANGVTTIRGMLGRASHLELRDQLAAGKRFGPRLVTSGPSLNGRSVSGAREAARMVREQHAAGYDFIKVHPGLDSAEFEALAAAANELGMPYAGHVPVAAGVRRTLALGMATIDHLDGYFASLLPADSGSSGGYGGFFDVMLADEISETSIRRIAKTTARSGTWNVPTEILVEQVINDTPVAELKSRPEMRYVSAENLRRWGEAKQAGRAEPGFNARTAARAIELRRLLILELHKAGAGLLLGSDAPQVFNVPGFSLHRELGVLVAAGLTPYEALRTGTVNVAEFLGTNTGRIELGRDADLVLLDANPLTDIANSRRVHGVMVRGDWFSRRDLDARLEQFVVQQGK
ncbi:MAG: amidohydrolase family protein [Pseudomonadota bacterium]